MSFGTAVSTVFSKYVGFQGRARRSEYWWWILFSILVGIVCGILDSFVDPPVAGQMFHTGYIADLAQLALFLPSLAVAIRRLHDTDRSGWWYLLVFAIIIGWIILIIWFCQKGTAGSNKYGPDPTTTT